MVKQFFEENCKSNCLWLLDCKITVEAWVSEIERCKTNQEKNEVLTMLEEKRQMLQFGVNHYLRLYTSIPLKLPVVDNFISQVKVVEKLLATLTTKTTLTASSVHQIGPKEKVGNY